MSTQDGPAQLLGRLGARGWDISQVTEIFDEVDEEVRREQLKKLWDKYSIYIVGAAFLVVAAVGGWRGCRGRRGRLAGLRRIGRPDPLGTSSSAW